MVTILCWACDKTYCIGNKYYVGNKVHIGTTSNERYNKWNWS